MSAWGFTSRMLVKINDPADIFSRRFVRAPTSARPGLPGRLV